MKLPLEIRDAIQVKANAPGRQTYFDSRLEEVTSGELLISWPRKASLRMPLRELQALLISFSREQRIYEFEASVLDVINEPVPLVAIRATGALRSVQRRDDYRVRIGVPVELAPRVVGLAGFKESRERIHRILGQTVNLSAGGFSIHLPNPIPIGTIFEIRMTLPGEPRQPVQITGRVVHCTPMVVAPDAEPVAYDLGFIFSRISETARQRVVKFVFAAQRDERRQE
jgi:c-di-GMP-binding flagellar brake protein YcgR